LKAEHVNTMPLLYVTTMRQLVTLLSGTRLLAPHTAPGVKSPPPPPPPLPLLLLPLLLPLLLRLPSTGRQLRARRRAMSACTRVLRLAEAAQCVFMCTHAAVVCVDTRHARVWCVTGAPDCDQTARAHAAGAC
jgi:hypothetical protein